MDQFVIIIFVLVSLWFCLVSLNGHYFLFVLGPFPSEMIILFGKIIKNHIFRLMKVRKRRVANGKRSISNIPCLMSSQLIWTKENHFVLNDKIWNKKGSRLIASDCNDLSYWYHHRQLMSISWDSFRACFVSRIYKMQLSFLLNCDWCGFNRLVQPVKYSFILE